MMQVQCKHCGQVFHKDAHANTSASPTAPAAEVTIPSGKVLGWMRRTVMVPIAVLVVLCIVFNAVRFSRGLKCNCFVDLPKGKEHCYSFALWPLRFHLHTYSAYSGYAYRQDEPSILYHAPVVGVGFINTKEEAGDHNHDRMVALPVIGMGLFIAFVVFWWRLLSRQPV